MRLIFALGLFLLLLQLTTCSLMIGAFNIKTFGDKKMSNATLVEIIVKIVRRYDIVLIQEVRDSDLSATRKLMESVNKDGSPYLYEYIVSEPLGRSTYTERYLFIYRAETVTVADSFLYDDGCEPCGTDIFNREPFVVRFSSKYSGVWDFVLIPQHASPDFAVKEIDALYDVSAETKKSLENKCAPLPARMTCVSCGNTKVSTNGLTLSRNILLLGDFNAGCNYVYGSDWDHIRLYTDKSYRWLIPNSSDTTATNTHCPYDRIVAMDIMVEYVAPNSAAVYNYMTAFELSQSMALAVSDHFPVEVKLSGP